MLDETIRRRCLDSRYPVVQTGFRFLDRFI